jgi:hypothetical protein
MREQVSPFLENFCCNPASSVETLVRLEREIGIALPEDYRSIMEECNGGEGPVGRQYLVLWRGEEIADFNRDYQVNDLAPGLILFGSNGAGEGFGFDTRDPQLPIVQVPFIVLDLRHAVRVAGSFSELLMKMSRSQGSLL